MKKRSEPDGAKCLEKMWSLNISQTYGPPWPVTGIALPLYVLVIQKSCVKDQQKGSQAINSSTNLEKDFETEKVRPVNIILY
jgi:hypothetical protein